MSFSSIDNYSPFRERKFGISSKKKVRRRRKFRSAVHNEPEVENKELPRKVLVEIEVFMPTVDVKNNTLIPPKFDRPIFKYRDTDNEEQPLKISEVTSESIKTNTIKNKAKFSVANEPIKTSGTVNESSNIDATKKRNDLDAVIKDEQLMKTSDIANKSSDIDVIKKISKLGSVINEEQSLKTPGIDNENSNVNEVKKSRKDATVIKGEQPLKASDIANESSNIDVIKKRNLDTVIKDKQSLKTPDITNKKPNVNAFKNRMKRTTVIKCEQPLNVSDIVNASSNNDEMKKRSKYATAIKDKQSLKPPDIANKKSNVNTIKKRSKCVKGFKSKLSLKTSNTAKENSNVNAVKKGSKCATVMKNKQPLKIIDTVNENSNANVVKKRKKCTTVIKGEQPLKASDIVNASSNNDEIKKRSKCATAIKAVSESISRMSQVFRLPKNKKSATKTLVILPRAKISSKKKQSIIKISIKTNKASSLASVKSVESNSSSLKFPLNENKTKSKGKAKDITLKNDLDNSDNSKLSFKSSIDTELSLKSCESIVPIPIKARKISSASPSCCDSTNFSLHCNISQPSEICFASDNTDSSDTSTNYKNKIFNNGGIDKHEILKVNETNLTNFKYRNQVTGIKNQKLIQKFHHSTSGQVTENEKNVPLHYIDAETRPKLPKPYYRYCEENISKRNLITKNNTNFYINEMPKLKDKRYTSHFSGFTITPIVASRYEKKRWRTQTGSNPAATVAGRRRLLQLMKSDERQ